MNKGDAPNAARNSKRSSAFVLTVGISRKDSRKHKAGPVRKRCAVYKGVIFDMDGTLVDSFETITRHCNQALANQELAPITKAQCLLLVGKGLRVLAEDLLKGYGIEDPRRMEQLRREIGQSYAQDPVSGSLAYPGVTALVRDLKSKGIQMAILTNKPQAIAQEIAGALFGEETFAYCIGQREDLPLKPDPTSLLWLMKKMDLEAAETIYVGDTVVDMETGRRAGTYNVGVLWGLRTAQELVEAGANEVIDQPERIGALFRKG